jgi:tRNA uridine 5-carbamoylmethylation protein Kti12
MTKVINIFGGPGVGKSLTAAELFVTLKRQKFNVELVTEYAKAKTYEKHYNILSDQLYLLAKQNRKLEPLRGVVDFIITDSPLPIGLIYAPENYYNGFSTLLLEVFNSYDNFNVLLSRNSAFKYNQVGRNQNEYEAKEKDEQLRVVLQKHNIKVCELTAGQSVVRNILIRMGIF